MITSKNHSNGSHKREPVAES